MNSLPADKLQEIQKAIELFSVGQGPAKTMEEASRRSYQFWDTQPVPKLGVTDVVALTRRRAPRPVDIMLHVSIFFFPYRGDGNVTRIHRTRQRPHSRGALQPPAGLQLGHPGPGKPGRGEKMSSHTHRVPAYVNSIIQTCFLKPAEGAVHSAQRELRGGRRQHVQI